MSCENTDKKQYYAVISSIASEIDTESHLVLVTEDKEKARRVMRQSAWELIQDRMNDVLDDTNDNNQFDPNSDADLFVEAADNNFYCGISGYYANMQEFGRYNLLADWKVTPVFLDLEAKAKEIH